MKSNHRFLNLRPFPRAAAMAAAMAAALPATTPAQTNALTLANPNWNITLTDYGYSDFL